MGKIGPSRDICADAVFSMWRWGIYGITTAAVLFTLCATPSLCAVPVKSTGTRNSKLDPVYPVSRFILSYRIRRNQLPSVHKLMEIPVHLRYLPSGYISGAGKLPRSPLEGHAREVDLSLADFNQRIAKEAVPFHLSAIMAIERGILSALQRAGIMGVYVVVSPGDFHGLRDIRPTGDTALHLIIHIAEVQQVRTITNGYGETGNQIDQPSQAGIRTYSPVKPATTSPAASDDLLDRKVLRDYLARLNLQSNRVVGVSISHGTVPDSVILNYMVHERKPWTVYSQVSNTGTPQTNPWIEQFGLIDTDLTGQGDILNVNYATAGFSRMQSTQASYQFPILGNRQLQGRVYGDYQQYNASNVGQGNVNFNGYASGGGGELIWNFLQVHSTFFYAVVGAQYLHDFVDNPTTLQSGTGDFFLPYVTLRVNQSGNTSRQSGTISVLGSYTSASQSTLNNLGRLNADPDWAILQANYDTSFYLEPIFNHDAYIAGRSCLANEMVFRISGQEAFGQRLIPEEETVIGGLYSVRGYPQSVVAGDSGVYGTAQYNLHIPRLFAPDSRPWNLFGYPFHFQPPSRFMNPDWDLVTSAFVDAGEVSQSQRQVYESGATLLSAGLGVKLTVFHNVAILADWAMALRGINAAATGQSPVSAGSSEFNFVFSVSY